MKTNDCVQCGYCCTVSACWYGKWNPDKKQCDYLSEEKKCLKYEEIVELEEDRTMFGCGCSSSLFNEVRDAKIQSMKKVENSSCIYPQNDA